MRIDYEINTGGCLTVMQGMDPGSAHCCVTSPPYWGLRDYKVDGQIGLEKTPEAFITKIVEVFREVRRVLRGDGTLWLNMGDSYANSGCGGGSVFDDGRTDGRESYEGDRVRGREATKQSRVPPGLKPKNLCGMPWRVALALQADGWYLRSDIIWAKPNPIPESVTDRPTKSHEHLFLLTQKPRYYYDAEAVREQHSTMSGWSKERASGRGRPMGYDESRRDCSRIGYNTIGRNLRDVWNIATEPFKAAHFATYPRKLVEPCVKAGTSDKGCCPECGAPWVRVVEKTGGPPHGDHRLRSDFDDDCKTAHPVGTVAGSALSKVYGKYGYPDVRTVGWKPGCKCNTDPVPCTVFDPFAGSGTTGVVATKLGRRFVGIELNEQYAVMARKRIENPEPLPEIVDVEGQEMLEFPA